MRALKNISPVDGRYYKATHELTQYFSEYALIRYRIMAEIEYFLTLADWQIPQLVDVDKQKYDAIRNIYQLFSEEDALEVKKNEQQTNHDIKAVEYFVKSRFRAIGLDNYVEFVHFGLTSQDINNTAFPLMIKEAQGHVMLPVLLEVVQTMNQLAHKWRNVPMLAYTHGQPASPTTLGKEILVFYERLRIQLDQLMAVPFAAKFGGATGNFNAHYVSYPDVDWPAFGDHFVNNVLGLSRTKITTQIEPYDQMAAFCDAYKRINNILIDMCRDIWTYISMNYFKLKIQKDEVGSSAMPHKVNPIDFENAEGNLGIANAIFEHLSAKLPISRLQRDLTDSTVLRNIGMPLAHTLIALKAIKRGLNKLTVNQTSINADLNNNRAVVAEAIQTILRREGYPQPYEKLKDLTRTGQALSDKDIEMFIDSLDIKDDVKNFMKKIKPENYIGMVDVFFRELES